MIELIGIHKSFGRQHVLRGVDLRVERGESLVVIGPSGCGKSVLLKHIIGLLRPDLGKVLIDGTDVYALPYKQISEVRKKFGMLFQGAALFDSMTVAENVGLGLTYHSQLSPEAIRAKVTSCLNRVGLENVEEKKPAELSGGMKKRVGLARAIAMAPETILYDEPTTGLDPIMSDVINELIIKMRQELAVTSIAVTHDMNSAYKIATRIAMLHEGVLIHNGTVEETKNSTNPIVQQFIQGKGDGPIDTSRFQ